MVEEVAGTGRSRERGNYNYNILYEKYIFNNEKIADLDGRGLHKVHIESTK